jgi:anthranilate synthase component 1
VIAGQTHKKKPASSSGYACVRLAGIADLGALHAQHPERYPHLLASTAQGSPRARYDILFAFPGESLTLDADQQLYHHQQKLSTNDFLAAFDREWRRVSVPADAPTDDAPPFTGGWFVYMGYELAAQIEPSIGSVAGKSIFPIASATRFPAAVINDHVTRQTLFVCETGREKELLPLLRDDVGRQEMPPDADIALGNIHEESPEQFLEQVGRIKDYIQAGDVFQVNLSRAWRIELEKSATPLSLFRRLSSSNPAPFAGLMTFDRERAIISSSPERLVEVRNGVVRTRPIAGTHPRSQDSVEDRKLSQALMQHPKERAEHIMLIDLERNDLGRVCRTGTVKVNELMVLESYRHVHHIVSEVSGRLRDGISPADVMRAVFPGGTITGCPKVRCMQIIAELEHTPRMAYTGSMGYVNRDGSMDLNILIRTLVQNGREIQLRAGAGIVADSIPERELQETRAKAKGLLAALGV